MKLSKKTVKAIRAKMPAVAKLPKVVRREVAIAILTGKRGCAARKVEVVAYADKQVSIRALQNNLGLDLKTGTPAFLDNGKLTAKSPKQARVELGGYVNGRDTGAKVEIINEAQFAKRAKKGLIHWDADDQGIHGTYIGDASQKGMCAVRVQYKNGPYYWQMESDSNTHNKRERGEVTVASK